MFIKLDERTIVNAQHIAQVWFDPEWRSPWMDEQPQPGLFIAIAGANNTETAYSLRYEGPTAVSLWTMLQERLLGVTAPEPAPAFAQPAFFPAGEDTPLFTQPDAPAEPCSRCNRHPAESGLARWQGCDVCGAPVCDSCYYDDVEGNGHYCGIACANYNNGDRPD